MLHALEDEPEKGHRAGILLVGAALAALVQGGGIYAASQYQAPLRQKSTVITMNVVREPPPPPKEEPPPPKMEEPPPPPTQPPPPPKLVKKPEPPKPKPVEEPPPPPSSAPPPPLVTGIDLSSTVTGGKGPVVPIGNDMMGDVGDRQRPVPAGPGVRDGTGDRAVPAGPSVRTDPKAIARPTLRRYPKMAKDQGIEGVVRLALTIGTDGRVIDAKVIKGLGYGLDEAAVAMVLETWRYEPATVDGKPVVARLTQDVRFRLDDF